MSDEKAEHPSDTPPEGQTKADGATDKDSTADGSGFEDRYKELQRYTTKKSQELAEMRERVAKLEGIASAKPDTPPPPPPEPLPKWSDDEALRERLKDAPDSALEVLDELESRLNQRHQSELQQIVNYFDNRLATVTPEYQKRKELVEKLAEDPDVSGWTEADRLKAIVAVSKLLDTAERPDDGSDAPDSSEYKGASNGGRRVDTGVKPKESEHDKAVKARIEAFQNTHFGEHKPEGLTI
jgi:hypothetical protein